MCLSSSSAEAAAGCRKSLTFQWQTARWRLPLSRSQQQPTAPCSNVEARNPQVVRPLRRNESLRGAKRSRSRLVYECLRGPRDGNSPAAVLRDRTPFHSGAPRSAGIETQRPGSPPTPQSGPTPPQPRFGAGGLRIRAHLSALLTSPLAGEVAPTAREGNLAIPFPHPARNHIRRRHSSHCCITPRAASSSRGTALPRSNP